MKEHSIVSLGHIDISSMDDGKWDFDGENLRILPTRGFVMFPDVTFPISLGRESSVKTAEYAEKHNQIIGIVCQIDPELEEPSIPDDVYSYGVLAKVMKIFELPDGHKTAILSSGPRFAIQGQGTRQGCCRIELLPDPQGADDKKLAITADMVKTAALNLFRRAEGAQELSVNIESIPPTPQLVNMVATHTPLTVQIKERLLEADSLQIRAQLLLNALHEQEELMSIREEITDRTRMNINESQRQNFLQQQMETIRQELYGNDDDDVSRLQERADRIAFPGKVREVFDRELQKLTRFNPQSPDYAVQYGYLDVLLSLPWGVVSETSTDFVKASEILNNDHYGLEKVKERIIEQIAVMMNRPDGNNPIICLVGPPGVGKTSLGHSIADALGRSYVRVSLGGLHDESEIRGHRRTYIGAMPGRIIDALRRTGTSNPVMLLDEIDKIAADARSNPEAAMLEVLDPEQNCHFHDNYIDVDYDLSKVLFVATANTLSTLSRPLLDRMEIIDISGYLLEEKIEIAKKHLLPRIYEKYGVPPKALKFSEDAIKTIIEGYTSESGVRQLDKSLSKMVRRYLVKKLGGERSFRTVTSSVVRDVLGVELFTPDRYEGNDYPGVVTGLAWTAVGGEILYVESSLSTSKAPSLSLTGNLGDVMKESARIALEYIKSHTQLFGIDSRVFEQYSLHIHVPEGAIPKDGPSAGVTMVTSIVSAITRRKVVPRLAMTGEITLRGRVLPVGGVKEKILAAKRAGINTIVLSEQNRKDILDIEAKYLEGLKFIYVRDISQVIESALTDKFGGDPLVLDESTSSQSK